MTQITSTGIERTRLDQRLADLIADYKAIYGEDIQVNPDDLDGEWLGIMAERLADNDELVEAVYNSFNPNGARGLQLSRLVQLNGIKRIAGDYSVVGLTVVGTIGTFIPAGKVVGSTNSAQQWGTLTDVTIGSTGQATVNASPLDKGPITAAAGTLTEILTPIFGWLTVTNPVKAIIGRLEETDEELRARRKLSTSYPGQGFTDAIYAALANLNGVRQVRAYENDQLTVDANGQTPRTLHCVLEATSTDAEIGKVIYLNKPVGTPTIGSTEVPVMDSQGIAKAIRFSRAAHVPVYIRVNVTKSIGYPPNGSDLIKEALVAYGLTLKIGETLVTSRLYNPVNTVPSHTVTTILTSTLNQSNVNISNIAVTYAQLVDIDASRIMVVEV